MRLPGFKTAALVGAVLALAPMGSLLARADTPAARTLMADQLVNDARTAVRNNRLPLALANREALALLRAAHELDANSGDGLRALAEAAQAAHQPDLQQDALKNLIRLEPDNLVAQVQFLDLLAQRRQTVEQKLAIYQSAFDSTSLDPQVRSEMAVRLYRLLLQRGQVSDANAILTQALQLNDVNVGAWRELCAQYASTPGKVPEYLRALVGSLQANPYQPSALLDGAHLLAAHNEHGLAVDWYAATIDQMHINGAQPPIEEFQMLAFELAIIHKPELDALMQNLLAQEKPALPVLLLAYTLHAPQGVVPGSAEDPLAARIRKELAAGVAADPKNPQALADALWFDLFYAASVPEDMTKRLKKLEDLVTAADLRYQRLRGWQLLRANQVKAAKELLTPIAVQDIDAAFGLVRIAEQEGNSKAVAEGLQDLYATHPTGLLAVHVINEARKQGVTLTQTVLGQSLHDIAASYPQMLLSIQRQPRDIELIQPAMAKRRYAFGEPVMLDLTITNTGDHGLSVGPNGAIKVGFAVAGTLRGLGSQELAAFAIDNSPRVFRLDRHAALVQRIRLDQGVLRDVLQSNPTRMMNVGLTVLNEPRGTFDQLTLGLGGQVVPGVSFEAEGFLSGSAEAFAKVVSDLPTLPLEQRMLESGALAVVITLIKDEAAPSDGSGASTGGASAPKTLAQLRQAMLDALVARAQSPEPLEVAWLLRMAPVKDTPQELQQVLDKAVASKTPLVRMLWYSRTSALATVTPERHDDLLTMLRKAAASESDPLAKSWAMALVEDLTLPPPAVTAPATTGPASSEPATTTSDATTAPAASAPAGASAPGTGPAPAGTAPAMQTTKPALPGAGPAGKSSTTQAK